MKWIGQHIWDFVSRFRNDVYFEGLAETEETRGLVVDANGKVSINPLSGDEHATHVYENARNDEGSTIPVGTPVYSKGEIGGSERIKVGIADASDPAKMPAIGITNTELTTTGDTKDGLITLVGVYNTNLSGFSGVSENDIVYVAVGGGLTITKPTGVNLIQNIGIVLKTNGPGTIIQGLAVTCIGRTNDVPTPLYIDHANQRVGIGATSPTEKLEVSGNINASGGIQVGFGTFSGTSDTVTDAAIVIPENNAIYTLDGGQYLRNLIRKDSDVIKIGQPGTALVDEIRFLPGTLGFTSFYGDATEVARILANGNVGIGQTAPQTMLHLTTTMSSSPTTKLYLDVDGSNIDGGGAEIIFNSSASSGTPTAYNAKISGTRASSAAGSSQLGFWTTEASINPAPQERMRIDKDGNVGIGTTSPTNKLHVVGDTRIQGNLTVNGTYTQIDTDVNTTEQWLVTNDGTGPAAVINQLGTEDIFDVQDDGTSVFYIEDGGNIGIGTTSPGKRLDIRTNGTGDGITLTTSTPKTFAQIINGNSETFPYGKFSMNYGDTTPVQIIALSNELQLSGGYTTGGKITFRTGYGPSERMRLTDTGLGIGTTTPNEKLEVDGNIRLADSGKLYLWQSHDANYLQYYRWELNSSLTAYINNSGSGGVALKTAGNTRLHIDNSGNVGIGTTSPQSPLHVHTGDGGTYSPNSSHDDLTIEGSGNVGLQLFSPNSTYQYIAFGDPESANAGYVRYHHGSNTMVLRTNNQDRVNIDSSGNVGIGQTSPAHKLDVAGFIRSANTGADSTTKYSGFFGRHYTNSEEDVLAISTESTSSNNNIYIGGGFGTRNSATTIRFSTAANNTTTTGTERMRIDSSGNVGIGTTSPAYKLDVAGEILSDGLRLNLSATTQRAITSTGTDSIQIGDAGVNDFKFKNTAGTSMIIAASGKVGIGTTSPDSLLHVSADVSSGGVTNTGTITIEGRPAGYLGDDIATIDFHNTGVKYADIRMERGNAGNDSQLVFSTSDTGTLNDALIINEVGWVGIGTSSPQQLLDITNTTAAPVLRLSRNQNLGSTSWAGQSMGDIEFYTNDPSNVGVYGKISLVGGPDSGTPNVGYPDGHMTFFTRGQQGGDSLSERMRITDTGNVGIGTASPNALLDVYNKIYLQNDGTVKWGVSANAGHLTWDTNQAIVKGLSGQALLLGSNNTSARMTIDTSGNVGIGTTSPGEKLEVNGNVKLNSVGHELQFANHNVGGYRDGNHRLILAGYGGIDFVSENVGGMENQAKRVRITPSGSVGIGTTSPSARLEVSSDSSYSSDLNILSVSGTKTGGTAVTNVKGINVDIGSNDHVVGYDITNLYGAYINNNASGGSATVINNWYGVYVPAADADRVSNSVSAYFGDNVGIGTSSPDSLLHVAGEITAEDQIHFKANGSLLKLTKDSWTTATHDLIYQGWDTTVDDYIYLKAPGNTTTTHGVALIGDGVIALGRTNNETGAPELTSVAAPLNDNWLVLNSTSATFSGNVITGGNLTINSTYPRIFLTDSNHNDDWSIINNDGKFGVYNDTDTSYALTVDGSNNVGIGTTSPIAKLDVNGAASFSGNVSITGTGNLTIRNTSSNGSGIIFLDNIWQAGIEHDSGKLHFRTGGQNDRVTISSGGNVGIGNTSPINKLDVSGDLSATSIKIGSFASGEGIIRHSGGSGYGIGIVTGSISSSSIGLFVDHSANNRNVGIGTTSPSEKLEVDGNIAVSGSVQRQISTTHHTFTFGVAGSASQDYWVPFIGSSEQAAPNVTHRTIAPYSGILKKAIVHSTIAYGSSAQVRFHRIDNGTANVFANDNSTDDVTTNVTADMSTAYSSVAFDFTTGNTFSAGDQIGVSFVRDNTGLGDVAITLVWEYELF